jgi:hypothetical protein
VSTIDVDVGSSDEDDIREERRILIHRRQSNNKHGLLSWHDIIPLSLHAIACFIIAIVISTYEDYDVTHTRPNPSTIRMMPTSTMTMTSDKKEGIYSTFNFIGAATRGMGYGYTNREFISTFEEWYGSSATTLQWKPSYNEIMLHHRSERVPQWKDMMKMYPMSMEQLENAVKTLYTSLDELDELKVMADNYMWDEIRSYLEPTIDKVATITLGTDNDESPRSLRMALEYSMDVLRTTPIQHLSSTTSASRNVNELPDIIGFDWGSCALRHCGAKADAQEAVAELYSEVGMLEPFEVRFIIDVVERSIRDVLANIPDNIKPHQKDGTLVQYKPYVPYIAQRGSSDGYDISPLLPEYRPNSDYEYTQTLSELRVDLSLEE